MFTIDGDTYEAAPVMPAETLMEFAGHFGKVGDTPAENLTAMRGLLEMVLLPDSYERLAARLRSRENPVDIDQVSDLISWLLETYGLRPTRPSSSSPDGPPSPESGTSLTGITSAEELISSISPQNVF